LLRKENRGVQMTPENEPLERSDTPFAHHR